MATAPISCTAQPISNTQFVFRATGLDPTRTYTLWGYRDEYNYPVTPQSDGTAQITANLERSGQTRNPDTYNFGTIWSFRESGVPAGRSLCWLQRGTIANVTPNANITPSVVPTIPPFNPTHCTPGASNSGILTAFGCIQTNPGEFIGRIFGIILGLAGGIALLLIIYSGYRMVTAAGNPEALQGARETLTAAIVGLLFIIFSFVILEVIGVDVLRIPGFDTSSNTTPAPSTGIPVECRDAIYTMEHTDICGETTAQGLCDEYLRRSDTEFFSGRDLEIWNLCIAGGYIQ